MSSRKSNEERGLNDTPERTESELYNQKMSYNRIQGNDQGNVRNQRHAVPDAKEEPDDVVESFEKLDKDKRAREDLGKGKRSSADS